MRHKTHLTFILKEVASIYYCRQEAPGDRTHRIFLSLGLRHLVIVDEGSHVVGIVTRKDLDYAAEVGPWRRNKQVPKIDVLTSLASISTRQFANILARCSSSTPEALGPYQRASFST